MILTRIITGSAMAVIVAAVAVVPLLAIDYGGGSVQSYVADAAIKDGSIVTLVKPDAGTVKITSQDKVKKMFGVTVDSQQLPVTLTSNKRKNQEFVAVSGTYDVLVSTQSGPVEKGDFITLSSISGIGMNAGTEKTMVLGRAADSFNGKAVVFGTVELKDDSGQPIKTVKLGSIPVTIDIKPNPKHESTKSDLPKPLQRIGKVIGGQEVSPFRIYLSIAIAVVCVIAAIVIFYSGIRNAVISIGRNPMSKKSIFRALLEVILTGFLVLIIGFFAVYLLLKL